eukprot:maker-scaffold892_size84543-snap-gene-0.17 protein:Tk08292 transcript:maker-scaffold892_size84543-snap-gene-0.17-mRNA-1 annotation:"peptidyl-trna hydrolase"
MKVVFFFFLSIFVPSMALPGGYKNLGGVYTPTVQLDYMDAAKSAGKFAWSKKFEDELDTESVARGERKAEYIPQFFTSQENHAALTGGSGEALRQQRETPAEFNSPLYYQA